MVAAFSVLRIRGLLSLTVQEEAARVFAIDKETRVLAFGQQFHQPVFPVFRIQVEGQPYQTGGGNHAESDAKPLIDTRHINNDEDNEHGQQSARENKEVLAFQTLELDALSDSFIYIILHSVSCLE
ncbi:hypothetical protein FACS1894155_04870 [Bacteroidia bacterium]|nr:hypothetical protein FACS1894155_04870 [Bacteroidia bacterium]